MDPVLPSRRSFLGRLAAAAAAAPIVSRSPRIEPDSGPAPVERSAEALRHESRASSAPILVTLWFDTEDYILVEDDDATLRLASLLTELGVKATFKVVGEKARVLESRGRRDVIDALQRHDIGFHANTHSQQPTVAVYLQHAGWLDGAAEFVRREGPGARDVERIFGRPPLAYGQPGSAWAPQAYPALRQLGIPMYLDEADHVGIDDQPFYYGGLLNVFRMRSTLARMELAGGDSLENGKAAFTRVADALRARGGGTISVYYHPNEWVQTEFWDAVNFSKGANPPRGAWRRPGTRPRQETERAFADFEGFIRFILAQPGTELVPASGVLARYADAARDHVFTANDVAEIAGACTSTLDVVRRDGFALSAADCFSLLTAAAGALAVPGRTPDEIRARHLDGPTRTYARGEGRVQAADAIPWEAFARALADVAASTNASGRVPDEVWIGAECLAPADFLATVAGVLAASSRTSAPPAAVTRRTGRVAAERFVSEDSPALWNWPIFPEGFHAPTIMAHARLQAWTLKPAILKV
jgi:hypothetical protein